MDKGHPNPVPADPPPVPPGPFGLHFTVFDHRGVLRRLAKASWAERFRHSPEVAKRIPGISLKASSAGLFLLAIMSTFVLQDFVQRAMAGSGAAKPADINSVTQAIGLFAPFFLTMLFGGAGFLAVATRVWVPGVARQWLAMKTCASCRYDLAQIEADADGCTVCPECGGAWKVEANSEPRTSIREGES